MKQSDQLLQEKLSALLDDELEVDEQDAVLTTISGDAGLAATWQRYHLIRAVVKREVIHHIPDLPERIAPLLASDKTAVRQAPPVARTMPKWVPGLALAASVAGLASLGLFGLPKGTEVQEASQTAQISDVSGGTRWDTDSPDHQHVLNAFLVEHGEFTPVSNMNGLTAYARFVSYDADN